MVDKVEEEEEVPLHQQYEEKEEEENIIGDNPVIEVQPIEDTKPQTFRQKHEKWFPLIVLVIALFSVSSAATALKSIYVSSIMKAAWRLQATCIILFPGFLWDYKHADKELRQRWRQPRAQVIILASGICLAIHFGSWIWSIDHTSLPHSLLFVTAHPLVIVVGQFFLRLCKLVPKFPTIREVIGSILGFLGLAVSILDVQSEGSQVTILGDMAAFLGAIAIIGYLFAGRHLRPWMPLFLYALPVTFISAITLSIASFLVDVPYSLIFFGWLTQTEWFLLTCYIAVFPGFFGHTGINYCIKHIHPLTVSVTLLLEPVVGSFIGYIVGVSALPGVWTFVGAPIVLLGLLAVLEPYDSFTSRISRLFKRKKEYEQQKDESLPE